jgi:hypothetical protein
MLSNPRPRVLCVDDHQDPRVMFNHGLKLALIEAKAVGTAAHVSPPFNFEPVAV